MISNYVRRRDARWSNASSHTSPVFLQSTARAAFCRCRRHDQQPILHYYTVRGFNHAAASLDHTRRSPSAGRWAMRPPSWSVADRCCEASNRRRTDAAAWPLLDGRSIAAVNAEKSSVFVTDIDGDNAMLSGVGPLWSLESKPEAEGTSIEVPLPTVGIDGVEYGGLLKVIRKIRGKQGRFCDTLYLESEHSYEIQSCQIFEH